MFLGFFSRFKTPKATVSLKIQTNQVELGKNLEGVIAVVAQEEFDSTEIRAELRCVERQRKERWIYKILDERQLLPVPNAGGDANTLALHPNCQYAGGS